MWILKEDGERIASFKKRSDAIQFNNLFEDRTFTLHEIKTEKFGRRPKFSTDEIYAIKHKFICGTSKYRLAQDYHVSWTTISNIITDYEINRRNAREKAIAEGELLRNDENPFRWHR